MGQYSIRDLEQLSGIKAHTIRIWEKRYGLINPGRTCTNIRLYNDDDLKKILNISILSRHGLKISKIASLCDEEMREKILLLSQHSNQYEDHIEALVVSMIELDEDKFNRLLSSSVMKLGFEETFTRIIFPFLEKIGILWQSGAISPAHEHFITNLIRQKLIAAIDGTITNQHTFPRKFLLFLPEGEMHELGLLYYHYLLARRGHKVIYLGNSVPLNDLLPITKHLDPDYLITFFVTKTEESAFNRYVNFFAEHFSGKTVFICGQQAVQLAKNIPSSIHIVSNPVLFTEEIKKIS